MTEESKYVKCWICGSFVLKARIENHHYNGKYNAGDRERTIPLCILCHDLIDRMKIDDIDVFTELMENTIREFEELAKEKDFKYKWTKVMILKFNKILRDKIELDKEKLKNESSLHKD